MTIFTMIGVTKTGVTWTDVLWDFHYYYFLALSKKVTYNILEYGIK